MPADAVSNLVCFALAAEAQAIPWKVWGWRNKILITGIGKGNAEQAVRDFLSTHTPKRIFTCGFAGGLNPELAVGEVVFETSDDITGGWLENVGARRGKFFCSARVATTVAEKEQLRRATGADGVEMESEIIQAIGRERGIPCATVRAISDAAGDNLPLDFNRLANADQSLNYRRLAGAIARAPWKIPALIRLQRHCRCAAERLAAVLVKVCGER